jgi:hypothetical protein
MFKKIKESQRLVNKMSIIHVFYISLVTKHIKLLSPKMMPIVCFKEAPQYFYKKNSFFYFVKAHKCGNSRDIVRSAHSSPEGLLMDVLDFLR